MKTGIFGGSFNPFHNGHKKALVSFIKELSLDRVLVIPTAVPPHKEQEKEISDADRLKITELSVSDIPKAEISDFEIENGGKSYTYITAEYLKNKYPSDELYLYVGTDMFLTFHKWKNPEKIIKNVTIAAFARENGDIEKLNEQKEFLEKKYKAKCFTGVSEPFEISSTEIRKMLKNNSDVSDYIDPKAEEYIKAGHLYSLPCDEQIISVIKPLESPKRFLHSLGVRDKIKELAEIYGCDVRKAEVCGLIHDITKNFPNEWHLDFIKRNSLDADDDFLKSPALYHALTGSEYARQVLKIEDKEVLSAIRFHTTAKPDMTTLEKLLYIADATEPSRNYEDIDFYRRAAREDINRALALILKWSIEYLQKREAPVYKDTLDAYEFYKKYAEQKG